MASSAIPATPELIGGSWWRSAEIGAGTSLELFSVFVRPLIGELLWPRRVGWCKTLRHPSLFDFRRSSDRRTSPIRGLANIKNYYFTSFSSPRSENLSGGDLGRKCPAGLPWAPPVPTRHTACSLWSVAPRRLAAELIFGDVSRSRAHVQ